MKGCGWVQQAPAPFSNPAQSLSWPQRYQDKGAFLKSNPISLLSHVWAAGELPKDKRKRQASLETGPERFGYCVMKLSVWSRQCRHVTHLHMSLPSAYPSLQSPPPSKSCEQIKLPSVTPKIRFQAFHT